ncbi:MAG: class I SAM-dependent methyltransferase, partial [Muribaculaceae bacterium]|nr:class I SAM-dependent methyltransferase [Muribaculaceae bacterium]
IRQIECRKRFGKKLTETLTAAPRFYFPTKLSGEQSTSDLLAAYHAELVIPEEPLIDLTSGLGVDIFHCAKMTNEAVAVERSEELAQALQYNATELDCRNLSIICNNCCDVVSELEKSYATAFIDPARRSADGGRVFSLSDCEPDVVAMLPELKKMCRRLIVKMSPMLDINHTIATLGGCSQIISLGNTTECKELIAVIDFDKAVVHPIIEGLTLNADRRIEFKYTQAEEDSAPIPRYTLPSTGDYFYEPYPAVMKLGANKLLAQRFNLAAFHPNSRLYHSPVIEESFPGEIFRIEAILDFSSKILKRFKRDYPQINVGARNFGMTAEELRKKLGVKDGGTKRIIGITDSGNIRRMIVVSPL